MRKLLLTAILIMAGMIGFAQVPQDAKTYEKDGKTYVEIEVKKESSYVPTNIYAEYKGKEYQVYSHVFTKGERKGQTGYFIEVTSKNGKKRWKEVTISSK